MSQYQWQPRFLLRTLLLLTGLIYYHAVDATTITLFAPSPTQSSAGISINKPQLSFSELGVGPDGTTFLEEQIYTGVEFEGSVGGHTVATSHAVTTTREATIVADKTHLLFSYSPPSIPTGAFDRVGTTEECTFDESGAGTCVAVVFGLAASDSDAAFTQTYSGPGAPWATITLAGDSKGNGARGAKTNTAILGWVVSCGMMIGAAMVVL